MRLSLINFGTEPFILGYKLFLLKNTNFTSSFLFFSNLEKRVYGVASIRNDLVAPSYKKVMDRKNYGNDGNIWSIVSPSVFTQHGVYEKDVLKPRSKDELKVIFKNIGYDLSSDLFEQLWSSIESKNPYGVVSVEEFRNALAKVDSEKIFKPSQVAV